MVIFSDNQVDILGQTIKPSMPAGINYSLSSASMRSHEPASGFLVATSSDGGAPLRGSLSADECFLRVLLWTSVGFSFDITRVVVGLAAVLSEGRLRLWLHDLGLLCH